MIRSIATPTATIAWCPISAADASAGPLGARQRRDIDALPEGKRRGERAAVYRLINRLTGTDDLLLGHQPSGAPLLLQADGAPSPLCISLSHSREYAAVAIGSAPVGIDIEQMRAAVMRTRAMFLSEEEQARVIGEWPTLAAWTVKEAAYKLASVLAPDRHTLMFAGVAIAAMERAETCGCEGFRTRTEIRGIGEREFVTIFVDDAIALTYSE